MKRFISLIVLLLIISLVLCLRACSKKSELKEILCSGRWESTNRLYDPGKYVETYYMIRFHEDGSCEVGIDRVVPNLFTTTFEKNNYSWKIKADGRIAIIPEINDSEDSITYLTYENGMLVGFSNSHFPIVCNV